MFVGTWVRYGRGRGLGKVLTSPNKSATGAVAVATRDHDAETEFTRP